MGIIFGPLMLVLVVHLVPGLWLGATGVFHHPDRRQAFTRLLQRTLLLLAPSFSLPFLYQRGGSVDFFFMLTVCLVGGAVLAYGYVLGVVRGESEAGLRRIDQAAAFFAGGLFPIAWFNLAGWLMGILNITWRY